MEISLTLYEIKRALLSGTKQGKGPANLLEEARDPQKWEEIRRLPFYEGWVSEVRQLGEKFRSEPIRSLPLSLFRLFEESGDRKQYEREYFCHRGRLNTFAVLVLLDGKKEDVRALEDIIWAICDEYTWVLPAHFSWENKNIVDLFSAETGFALSEICSLLEDKLSPRVVERARNEVRRRVLEPFCSINRHQWWEASDNNWAAVCAGSIGAAAMYLIDDPDVLAPIIYRLISALNCFLSGFKDDGACTEGLSYWNYGFGFYTCFSELLRERTAGAIDLLNLEKVKSIALFQQKCFLTGNSIVSFSDASRTSSFRAGLTHRLKMRFPEVEIPEDKYRARFSSDQCYRWAHNIRDFVWSNPKLSEKPEKDGEAAYSGAFSEASYYLKDSQWLISRKSPEIRRTDGDMSASHNGGRRKAEIGDKPGLMCLAVKAGHNGEPHNHNDVGNFIFHVNGDTLLTDTGAGEYTKAYFREERYNYFCNSSRGHSVPIIGGRLQKAGKEYRAAYMDVKSEPEQERVEMEIAGSYGLDNLISLKRQLLFSKRGEGKLVLNDHFSFRESPSEITERFISFFCPMLKEEGCIEIMGTNGGIIMHYDPEVFSFSLKTEDFTEHDASHSTVYIVDLTAKKLEMEQNLSVEITPVFLN